MITVVCDANILIDLLQVDLFNAFTELKWEMYFPPNVVGEVQEDNSDQLIQAIRSGKIILPVFTPEDLFKIQGFKTRYPPLSIEDCSCLLITQSRSAILLTGERKLRIIATESHRLKVHGVLWVFEKLIEKKIIIPRKAHVKLVQLMTLNNRLPKPECERRLKRWEKSA